MRVAYVAAGAGGMYCGSCIHDNALVTAMLAGGEDAVLLPIYMPLRTDEPSAAGERIFYGAINVFLEQKFPWFRRLPGFVHHWLDRPGLLKRLSASSSAIDAKQLGALTLSMLEGEEGRQGRELEELVQWLADSYRPDVIHLAYSMLLGLAPAMKRELGVPIVCSLQGEDIFLEELDAPYRERVLEVLRRQAGEVDQFLSTSEYYADFMVDYLQVPRSRISVATIGINLDGHRRRNGEDAVRSVEPLHLGFLARICPEKGLHVLCEAFRLLSEKLGAGGVKLHVAGYLGGRDRSYLTELRRQVRSWGLEDHFDYRGEVDRVEKIRFLQSLDVLSVPTTYREPKGLYVLEALANRVPVVQPDHGSFPELIRHTGGGVLVTPGSAEELAQGILDLWHSPEKRGDMGRRGQAAVHERYSAACMAEQTLEVYRQVLER